MLQVAFTGTFAAHLEQPARRHLAVPCEIIVSDEAGIVPRLGEVDVLVGMAFTVEMARSAGSRPGARTTPPTTTRPTAWPSKASSLIWVTNSIRSSPCVRADTVSRD